MDNILLKELLEDKHFTRKWNVSTHMIEKCQDCQFKYMCLNNLDIYEVDKLKYKGVYICNFNPNGR